MAKTVTDTELLAKGAVGSIRIEKNTNDIRVYEYNRHIIVSANTCIGCDLRGFDASSLINKGIDMVTGKPGAGFPRGVNFRDSDLSYSKFTMNPTDLPAWRDIPIYMYRGNFENVNFTGADLSRVRFDSCNFKRTDFTRAVLTRAGFYKAL